MAPDSPLLCFTRCVDKLQVSFQSHYPGASPKSYHAEMAHLGNPGISQKEEKRFASILAIFSCLSAQGSEKLFVGFVYRPLKSVGNSCYFRMLQAICKVIFSQQHWVNFIPIPESIPSSCDGQHPPTAPSSSRSAFRSLFHIGHVSPIKV